MNKVVCNEELFNIVGGSITATLLNSVSRLIDTIINAGQLVGSSIRRLATGKVCKL